MNCKPSCPGCGKEYLIKCNRDDDVCDDCFICHLCEKRFAFYIEDPPPFGICDDCLDMEIPGETIFG